MRRANASDHDSHASQALCETHAGPRERKADGEDSDPLSGIRSTPPPRLGSGARSHAERRAAIDPPRLREALAILRRVARGLFWRIGGERALPFEELLAHGRLTVVEILRDYDEARGVFSAYAVRRIVWGLLDAVRRDTHVRARVSRAAARAALRQPRPRRRDYVSRDDEARDRSAPLRGMRHLLEAHAAALAVGLAPAGDEDLAWVESPEQEALRRERARALWDAVAALPDPRQRALLVCHYQDGVPLEVAARSLGVSKSWASRLHTQALTVLQRRLANLFSDGAPRRRGARPPLRAFRKAA